jgi:hypothetical protein
VPLLSRTAAVNPMEVRDIPRPAKTSVHSQALDWAA